MSERLWEVLDGVWGSDDPEASRYVELILDGHDPYEASRIIQAGGDQ